MELLAPWELSTPALESEWFIGASRPPRNAIRWSLALEDTARKTSVSGQIEDSPMILLKFIGLRARAGGFGQAAHSSRRVGRTGRWNTDQRPRRQAPLLNKIEGPSNNNPTITCRRVAIGFSNLSKQNLAACKIPERDAFRSLFAEEKY
jgi:hypothetical protein